MAFRHNSERTKKTLYCDGVTQDRHFALSPLYFICASENISRGKYCSQKRQSRVGIFASFFFVFGNFGGISTALLGKAFRFSRRSLIHVSSKQDVRTLYNMILVSTWHVRRAMKLSTKGRSEIIWHIEPTWNLRRQ